MTEYERDTAFRMISGRTVAACCNYGNVNKVQVIFITDIYRRVTERYVATAVSISQERVHSIMTEDLVMRKLLAHWLGILLTVGQIRTLLCVSLFLLEEDLDDLLQKFVTTNELGFMVSPKRPYISLNNGSIWFTPTKKAKTAIFVLERLCQMMMLLWWFIISIMDKQSTA